MLSSTNCGMAATGFRRSRSRCRGRRGPPGRGRGLRAARRFEALEMASAALGIAVADGVAVGAGVQLDHLGAAAALAASIWRGSASMNSETRMPASRRRRTTGREALWPPTTSRPPSVVTSSRRSGTRQAAWGRWRSAMATISAVTAISKFSGRRGLRTSAVRASMSASRDVAAILAQVGGDAVGAGARWPSRRRAPDRAR